MSRQGQGTATTIDRLTECATQALYSYNAVNDDEHTFNAGDIFDVLSKDSENWWTARYKGHTALLPANYVEEI